MSGGRVRRVKGGVIYARGDGGGENEVRRVKRGRGVQTLRNAIDPVNLGFQWYFPNLGFLQKGFGQSYTQSLK